MAGEASPLPRVSDTPRLSFAEPFLALSEEDYGRLGVLMPALICAGEDFTVVTFVLETAVLIQHGSLRQAHRNASLTARSRPAVLRTPGGVAHRPNRPAPEPC